MHAIKLTYLNTFFFFKDKNYIFFPEGEHKSEPPHTLTHHPHSEVEHTTAHVVQLLLKYLLHHQERLMGLCIIKKCMADSSVSRGADAGYSTADRLTDWG